MNRYRDVRRSSVRALALSSAEPQLNVVLPFGRYGGGHFTGHPIGLVIVGGLLLMGLVGLPEARWFFGGSLALGCVVGFLLWLRRR